jgi:hypothetical protein
MRAKTMKAVTKAPNPKRNAARKSAEQPIEYDRRGKPLPARARVGGIITPQ